jgi:hypothetical protein
MSAIEFVFCYFLRLLNICQYPWIYFRTRYEEHHHLPAAIKAAAFDIKDAKAVVRDHLHLDQPAD